MFHHFEFNLLFYVLCHVIGLFILVSCSCIEWCILGTLKGPVTVIGSFFLAQMLFGLSRLAKREYCQAAMTFFFFLIKRKNLNLNC